MRRYALIFSMRFHEALAASLIFILVIQGAVDEGRRDMLHTYLTLDLSQLTNVEVGG